MRMSVHFSAKNFGFFEIYDAFSRSRGLSKCRHYTDKREGVNFSRFYADDFYGRSLICREEQLVRQFYHLVFIIQ